MTTFTRTINETIEELHAALREYIEAAYHISDPAMVTSEQLQGPVTIDGMECLVGKAVRLVETRA
jgi:hypothetical protein